MIKIYTAPSCSSCRKAKEFFKKEEIPYQEKNIFVNDLNDKELIEILTKTENGTEDIISTRSKIIKESGTNIDDMTIKELVAFIRKNPSVLKRPIMVDETKVQVGYNSEEIRVFIPHEKRVAEWSCKKSECPSYPDCDSH
ncbi:MAG: transcriptional regulator Spx [Bacilli bacterium]|jgi:regulatory protein spx|nr:transcriptional regulator Spx [Bacilli bacterium]